MFGLHGIVDRDLGERGRPAPVDRGVYGAVGRTCLAAITSPRPRARYGAHSLTLSLALGLRVVAPGPPEV